MHTRPDLLVIGGGMAGLTAAAWVVRHGGAAVVVERAPELGGSARYAGYLHTATSADQLREADPTARPELQEQLVDGFGEAMEWVGSLGVDRGPEVAVLRLTRGRHIDTNGYINTSASIVGADNILVGARTERLRSHDGRVSGADGMTADGRSVAAATSDRPPTDANVSGTAWPNNRLPPLVGLRTIRRARRDQMPPPGAATASAWATPKVDSAEGSTDAPDSPPHVEAPTETHHNQGQ